HRPAELRRPDVAAPHGDVGTFPQGLDAVQAGALDGDMVGIPQRRPAKLGHFAIPYSQAVVMPEGLAQIEKAARRRHIRTLCEGALSAGSAVKAAVPHRPVRAAVQRPLRVTPLILNTIHTNSLLFPVLSCPCAHGQGMRFRPANSLRVAEARPFFFPRFYYTA